MPFERGEQRGRKIFWQRNVWISCKFQRHNGDHLRKKGETGSVKGETKSANSWQGKAVNSPPILGRQWWRHFRLSLSLSVSLSLAVSVSLSPKVPLAQYRKRGSASYILREVLSVRERERERDTDRERERRKWVRRKWRHHCRAKIGDEFTLSLAKNWYNWRWAYTFPCQKFALFVSPFTLPVSPFTERSPLWRWNSQWVPTFHCQKFFRPLCSPSFKWHEPRDEWSKTQDKWSNPAQSYFVLPIEKMNQINTKNYWK